MNFLLAGKLTIYGSLKNIYSKVTAYSLVEMYNSLFPNLQFDDRDVVESSQSSSGRTRDLVNRFQSIELDASTEEGSSSSETLSSQLAPPSTVTTIAGQIREEHCPRIVGDSLGEASEFYEGIQVGMPTVIWYSSNDTIHRT
jgi:hypothetical protein